MTRDLNRRAFLGTAAAAVVAASLPLRSLGEPASTTATATATTPGGPRKFQKALKIGMLPKELGPKEKFEMAKRCGFEGIDGEPIEDLDEARKQAELARSLGIPFHGIVFGGWHAPLSDPDPAVQKKGMEGMQHALKCAKVMGVDTVLLVPAIVTETVSYADAYKRSQENVARLIPVAEDTGVTIAIENVWNKFLLSPLEFARYLDELNSPKVKAYFDIGNVIIYGFAQHWIRTLDKRIIKLDVKDFKRKGYEWVNLLDGDVNWKACLEALDEIGYRGWMTAEIKGGDEPYLTDMASRMDKIITGDLPEKK